MTKHNETVDGRLMHRPNLKTKEKSRDEFRAIFLRSCDIGRLGGLYEERDSKQLPTAPHHAMIMISSSRS
ncbi:hypothetical protein PILCRDRAFT_820799 [Piloderma croceum F 1598]|uniref:Uncharacterized protein n=1 Tax=Piloderma croceum (strain F 1598) TaxID=765440 RepID=A0A0C3FS19_PILCF|nr:hypothetical protein PILCRDRAFT_820799 [Piloderma croceum F 1598]